MASKKRKEKPSLFPTAGFWEGGLQTAGGVLCLSGDEPASQRASDASSPGAAGRGSGWLDAFGFSFGFPIGPSRPLPPSHPRFLQQLDRTLPVLPTVLLHFARTSVSASHLSAARPVSLSLSRHRSRPSVRAFSLSPSPLIYPLTSVAGRWFGFALPMLSLSGASLGWSRGKQVSVLCFY